MSLADELAGLRAALEMPTVGRPSRAQESARLRHLIDKYTEEARQMIAALDGE